MANAILVPLSIFTIAIIISHSTLANALSSCDGTCQTLNDCAGQLICINGKCDDDPDVGTNICDNTGSGGNGGGSGGGGKCRKSGTVKCHGKSFSKFTCSPPISSSTPAKLTWNDFSEGGDGGGASECDGKFHDNSEKIVALSTGWYNGGSRCGKKIRIVAENGRSTTARVVDECDSRNGCPTCDNNIVDGSDAVWKALRLDVDIGVVPVTWSMA